jgi:hypothetical protein
MIVLDHLVVPLTLFKLYASMRDLALMVGASKRCSLRTLLLAHK